MNHHEPLENPVLGYVVVTVALVVGILSASVFGGNAVSTTAVKPTTNKVASMKHRNESELEVDTSVSANPPANQLSCAVSRRWVLGVRAEATAAGCVIKQVIHRSAAQRAGLAVGDRIITVDGQQVGWVGKTQSHLHRCIDRSKTGHARLLIQRAHHGGLVVVQVRLKTVADELGH